MKQTLIIIALLLASCSDSNKIIGTWYGRELTKIDGVPVTISETSTYYANKTFMEVDTYFVENSEEVLQLGDLTSEDMNDNMIIVYGTGTWSIEKGRLFQTITKSNVSLIEQLRVTFKIIDLTGQKFIVEDEDGKQSTCSRIATKEYATFDINEIKDKIAKSSNLDPEISWAISVYYSSYISEFENEVEDMTESEKIAFYAKKRDEFYNSIKYSENQTNKYEEENQDAINAYMIKHPELEIFFPTDPD